MTKQAVETIEPIEVNIPKELPTLFIAFPDVPLSFVIDRVDKIEDRLYTRGRRVVRPLKIYRYHTTRTRHVKGAVTTTQSAYTMLAVELEEVKK